MNPKPEQCPHCKKKPIDGGATHVSGCPRIDVDLAFYGEVHIITD